MKSAKRLRGDVVREKIMKIVDVERPLNLAAAADFLGCSTYTLADKARAGLVRGVKCGGWKFMHEDLVAYVRGKNKPDKVQN